MVKLTVVEKVLAEETWCLEHLQRVDERMTEERNRLWATFDQVAPLYDEARPTYPDELFDDVVSLSGVPPAGRILEIGCGTGR